MCRLVCVEPGGKLKTDFLATRLIYENIGDDEERKKIVNCFKQQVLEFMNIKAECPSKAFEKIRPEIKEKFDQI